MDRCSRRRSGDERPRQPRSWVHTSHVPSGRASRALTQRRRRSTIPVTTQPMAPKCCATGLAAHIAVRGSTTLPPARCDGCFVEVAPTWAITMRDETDEHAVIMKQRVEIGLCLLVVADLEIPAVGCRGATAACAQAVGWWDGCERHGSSPSLIQIQDSKTSRYQEMCSVARARPTRAADVAGDCRIVEMRPIGAITFRPGTRLVRCIGSSPADVRHQGLR